ncbi:MAG: tetratricopeptide repeat protein [Patescibacteria group bacterium]|nr:tetratricopeptide repeat protein [Patescibacteria group bacterium]
MKKTIIFAMVMALIFGLSGLVLAEDNFTKAENFMKVNRYSDAIKVLEDQIQLKSDDARAYFMLGDIYLRQNSFAAADKEFQAAITFRKAYRSEVGKKFYVAGLARLNSGEVDLAKDLFQRTVKQDPAQAKNIATVCLQASKKYFALSQPEKAEKLLPLILSDKTLAPQIQAERTKYGENIIRQAQTREQGLKAVPYVGQARVDAVFPAPKWETVFSQTYVGKGPKRGEDIKKENFIKTVGKELKRSDKLIISGGVFRMFDGVWKEYEGHFEIINQAPDDDSTFIYIAAEEGVEVKVEVQRFIQPPKREDLVTLANISAK